MILDIKTIERVTGIALTPDQKNMVNEILIPVYLDAVSQFTNRSWFNAEIMPSDYAPKNPAIAAEKIPDSVVLEICSIMGNNLANQTDGSPLNVKTISEGNVSITYLSPDELQKQFSHSRVISYYCVPAI